MIRKLSKRLTLWGDNCSQSDTFGDNSLMYDDMFIEA